MPAYRFYFLDGDNHVVQTEQCESADDVSAIRWLQTVRDSRPRVCPTVEIWCRDRMVHREDLPGRTG